MLMHGSVDEVFERAIPYVWEAFCMVGQHPLWSGSIPYGVPPFLLLGCIHVSYERIVADG